MKRQLVTRGVLLTLAGALAVPQALASGQRPPSLVFERNLSATGDWHGGEPQVAVRGDDVVVVWPEVDNTGVYRNPITGTLNTAVGTVVGYANDPAFSRCGLAISHDGGRTFRRTILPAQTAQSTLCSDAITAFGPHGEVYAGTITFNQPTTPLPLVPPGTLPHLSPVQPGQGSADVVISSRDRGETWTHPPVDAIGNRGAAAKRYAPGSNPPLGGEGTSDRPFMSVDQSNGTLFVTASADLIQFNGTTETRSFVTASTNGGRSFGLVYSVDDPNWPQSGGIATIAAVAGRLVVAYPGSDPEGRSGIVLGVSTDRGRTFRRHLLLATLPSGGLSLGDTVAADRSHPGRIAVMIPTNNEVGVTVYRSSNYGVTWSKPEVVAVGSSRPWMAYGPRGSLGVMGRNVHSDSSQDILFAVSNNGKTFSKPLRVNRQTAPAPPPGTLTLYDDISGLYMTENAAWVTWGDWRRSAQNPNGEVQAWLAKIRLN
jgi:hypothetical protein